MYFIIFMKSVKIVTLKIMTFIFLQYMIFISVNLLLLMRQPFFILYLISYSFLKTYELYYFIVSIILYQTPFKIGYRAL